MARREQGILSSTLKVENAVMTEVEVIVLDVKVISTASLIMWYNKCKVIEERFSF